MSTDAAHIVTLQPGQTIMSADAIAHERKMAVQEAALEQIEWQFSEAAMADPALWNTGALVKFVASMRSMLAGTSGHGPVAVADVERAIGRATMEILDRGELTFA